jgi:hypothetical protein
MARSEITQDRMRFPHDGAVIVDDRNTTMRVHGRELGRIEAAESTASFDMPMREPELTDKPHELLHIEGTASSPDGQHLGANLFSRQFRTAADPRPARPGRASAGLPADRPAEARSGLDKAADLSPAAFAARRAVDAAA